MLAASGRITTSGAANILSAFTTTASGTRKRTAGATLNAVSTLSVDASRITTFAASLSSDFTTSIEGTRKRTATSAFGAAFTLSGIGSYKFTVPASRRFIIEPETRNAQILKETGFYTLDFETRINNIIPESREQEVDQETTILDANY